MLSRQCLWNKQEGDLHITFEDENQKVCISFIMYNYKVVLSICRVSLLWAEWHQLHQILTHCDYERQHTQWCSCWCSPLRITWGKLHWKIHSNSFKEHNSCPLLPGNCLLHILMELVTIEFSHKGANTKRYKPAEG